MDIAMFAVLIATLLPCSDVQGIIDTVRGDRYLTEETKTEIVEMLLKETPECELNERSENT
ncbi:MAG: hypothetical protein CL470_07705 [Acidimicrobiaceae bacterium]|nr:hypothetical protein [Acidimicrobiaceae bacterium]|tara:strand:- start:3070 stop:3252 length:183 start_codon:yes stop_codon:yes gene_type:complete